ncbi:MAG: hypothetical protein KGZ83_13775 [Sulfuricella sp.]|nr:hypothetical protein [Sulfuricella sp.]
MRSRLIFFLLLAISLLFTQQGVALHALSHLGESFSGPAEQEKHLPHSPACDKCVVYAGVGSAAASMPLQFSAPESRAALAIILFLGFFSATRRFYLSRAPPFLV